MKICKCGNEITQKRSKNSKYFRYACRECLSAYERKRYRANGGEQIAANMRLYRYGLKPDEVQSMYDSQNGQCKLCDKKLPSLRKAHIDHCHTTGEVRGMLCPSCNLMLGCIETNQVDISKIAQYLNRS